MNINQQPPENWLRQTLGEHSPEAPADAWQRLAPHLPQRKRRPFVFWFLWAARGGATLLLCWFLKSITSPALPPDPAKNGAPAPQLQPPVSTQRLEKIAVSSVAENAATATSTALPKNDILNIGSPQPLIEGRQNHPVATPAANDIWQKNTPALIGFSEDSIAAPFSAIPTLLQVERLLEKPAGDEKQLPELPGFTSPVLLKMLKTQRFWFGIEAAPVLYMRKNRSEIAGQLAFPETHLHPGYGWQAGVWLAAEPLKNWRVALGIRRMQETHEAAHSATLRLTDGVCLNPHDPGLKEYELQYAVVSGAEQSDLTLRLQQQDYGTAPDDEPFTLDMKTIHRSAAWSVPLTVERRFGWGKWQAFVRGGAVVAFSEKNTVEVIHFTEACQALCFHSGHTPTIQVSKPAQVRYGWLVGAGFDRQMTHRTALRFEPFFVGQKGSIQCGMSFGILFSN